LYHASHERDVSVQTGKKAAVVGNIASRPARAHIHPRVVEAFLSLLDESPDLKYKIY
jgi:hypothetical protein